MKCVIVMTLSYGRRALNGKTRAKPPCMAQWCCLFSQTLALSTQHNMRPADRSGQVVAPEPGQVATVYTLYTGPLLIRGKSDCWPLQLAGPGLSTLPTRSFRQLTQVQRVDSSAATVHSQVNHCWHLSSLKYRWLTEMQTSVDRHGLVKCSLHSSKLTKVQLSS